jgi:serralysin
LVEGDNDRLINSGTIGGDITSGLDRITIINSGKIVGSVSPATFRAVQLTNSGTIGNVKSAAGNDTVTNFVIDSNGTVHNGTINGVIDLRSGDDKFTGGSQAEVISDYDGADIYNLGGGNDTYIATGNEGSDGIDIVNGGAGIDTYKALSATNPVFINLDTVPHNGLPANRAFGNDVAGGAADIVTNFENVLGTLFDDIIYGNAADNVLNGIEGSDELFGLAGNDTLMSGREPTVLDGGRGKDTLTGGHDHDVFKYDSLKDSGVTKATRDVIIDFQHIDDTIDLSGIDANTLVPGDQAFTYLNNGDSIATPAVNFTGAAGELRSYWNAEGQVIQGDVNGDKIADFSIQISDPTHLIHVTSTDFNL